jgi:Domain of unknown function (DUF4386)
MKAQPGSRIGSRDPEPRTGDSQMTECIERASPRARARITGVVYFLFFLTAILGEFFTQQAGISGLGALPGDVAATANNILAHESSYLLGFALGLISTVCSVAVTALFYQLFKPVSRSLALLAAFFGLVGCAITAFGSLFQLAPLVVLGGSPYLSAFNVKQLQALALMFLSPPLANYLLTYLEVLGILAEVLLMLWLLVMGVNAQRWNERASAAGIPVRT